MTDDRGRFTIIYGEGWRVSAHWTRPWSKRLGRPARDQARTCRKRKRELATMRQLLATIEQRVQLREIEAVLDEMVAEGTAVKTPQGYMRRPTPEERRALITQWWNEGRSLVEIAEGLGSTTNAVGVDINRLRSEGVVLPYRYETRGRGSNRFPQCRA